jgi:TRAP-type C4-dicarboxylate transport system substrate-binding protein
MFISATTTIVPLYKPLAIWDTPFFFANREEAHAVLDSKVGQSLLEGVSGEGLVGLAYWELGFRNLTNNVRPVTRVEDFAGIRLRTMPSEVSINTFRRLGVDAKPLPFPNCVPRWPTTSSTARRTRIRPSCRRTCTRCRSTSP